MVTYEQALAIADAWLNGSAPPGQRLEVRTHEFDLAGSFGPFPPLSPMTRCPARLPPTTSAALTG